MKHGPLLSDDDDILRELERKAESGACPSHEEMIRLNDRRLKGDNKAREQMIVLNIPLARWFVMERIGINRHLEDNVQNAMLGLMEAVDRFDPSKSRFSTYAFLWMKQRTVRKHHDDAFTVRVPKGMRNEALKVHDTVSELRRTLEREPSIDEIAQKTGLTRRKIEARLKIPLSTSSLDADLSDPENDAFSRYELLKDEFPDPSDILESRDVFLEEYGKLLAVKGRIEQYCEKPVRSGWPALIYKRVGIFGYDSAGMSLKEIGTEIGICRERVRQIVNGCLAGCVTTKLLPEGILGLEKLVESLRYRLEHCLSGTVPHHVQWVLGYHTGSHSTKPMRRRTMAKTS